MSSAESAGCEACRNRLRSFPPYMFGCPLYIAYGLRHVAAAYLAYYASYLFTYYIAPSVPKE